MCTTPGISGQSFNYDNLNRIKELKKQFPLLELHVDGGIDSRISAILDKLNISLIVSGSYLANADDRELMERICSLKYSNQYTTAMDIMVPVDYVNTVDLSTPFIDIVAAIDKDKMATIIVCEEKKFVGVITDGDIRRSILSKQGGVFSLVASDMVNRKAFTVTPSQIISNLMFDIAIRNRVILAIPVVDNGMIVGIINTKSMML